MNTHTIFIVKFSDKEISAKSPLDQFSQQEITSPLEQSEIRNLISLDTPILSNLHLSLTNIGLFLSLGIIICIGLNILPTNYKKDYINSLSSLFLFLYKKAWIVSNSYFKKLFNTLTKALVIFTIGLVSRILIHYFYDIDVFRDYTNIISLIYYGIMSIATVLINELMSYFDFINITKINLGVFNPTCIIKGIRSLIYSHMNGTSNKSFMGNNPMEDSKRFSVNAETKKLSNVNFTDHASESGSGGGNNPQGQASSQPIPKYNGMYLRGEPSDIPVPSPQVKMALHETIVNWREFAILNGVKNVSLMDALNVGETKHDGEHISGIVKELRKIIFTGSNLKNKRSFISSVGAVSFSNISVGEKSSLMKHLRGEE